MSIALYFYGAAVDGAHPMIHVHKQAERHKNTIIPPVDAELVEIVVPGVGRVELRLALGGAA